MRVVLLLLLLFVKSSYQQCNTPIIRDIIDGGSGESNFINSLVGASSVPLINGSSRIELIYGSSPSNTPIFKLNASYYITAVDLQFGAAPGDTFCAQNVVVEEMQLIRIDNTDPPSVPIEIGYTNSANRINLLELGDPNNNRIIRLKLNPIMGKYIKYNVGTTDPTTGTSCLRTEIYGCLSTPPANSTLLQYNLIQPTQHADSLYTGVTSQGYLSGGEGLLNDGVIGTSPDTDPSQWLGWTDPSVASPEILLLFSLNVSVRTISLFYWGVSGTVSISNETGAVSESSQVTQTSVGVYRVVYSYDGLTAGLLKIDLTGSASVLLTEIEVLGPGGESLLGNQLDTSGFSETTPGTTMTTTTIPTMSVIGTVSSSPSISHTPVMTPINTITTTTPAPSGVSIAIIGAVIGVLVIAFLVILIVSLLIIFLLLWRKRRARKEAGYQPAKKDSRAAARQVSQSNEMGLYEPISKEQISDPLYEEPDRAVKSRPEKGYSTLIEEQPGDSFASDKPNGRVSAENQWYEGGNNYNIYARPEDVAVYATVNKTFKKTAQNKIYEEPVYDFQNVDSLSNRDSFDSINTFLPPSSIYETPALLLEDEGPRHFSASDVNEENFLGNGQFGEVMLATLLTVSPKEMGLGPSETKGVKVAIKKLMSDPTPQTKQEFGKEIKFMTRLNHPNVVRLLGVSLDTPSFLVMEYVENGDMAKFLSECLYVETKGSNLRGRQVNEDCMVYMGQQVASGMEYLSERNYIHRDLSARNCLVGSSYSVKVADFGMSQNLYSSEYFKITGRAILPIRWMATETFYGRFTVKSDVYAFGVTLWEVMVKGETRPYDEMTDQELIRDVMGNKENRVKLKRPTFGSGKIWAIITSCLEGEAGSRPTFSEVSGRLKKEHNFFVEEVTI